MTAPALRRCAVVVLGLAGCMLPAAPAYALADGEVPARGLGLVDTLLLFGGIPLSIAALIAVLVVVAGLRHRPRYRPGRPWDCDPVWFAGPADPGAALVAAEPGPGVTGGGASAEW